MTSGVAVVAIIAFTSLACGDPGPERLRIMIETDAGGDPDDEQSLIRFLLYANEWDVEGIIANRSRARDGENKNSERTGLGIVRRQLKAYGECYLNLVQHDPRFPTLDYLWQRTVAGYDDTDDGVKLILNAVDAPNSRPVWFCNWGTDHGSAVSCLKRALDRVLKERGPDGYAAFKNKLRLSSDNQFGEHTTTLTPPFKFWVDTFRPPLEGKRWYHRFSALTATAGGFDLNRDVLTGHGPLGALYPTNTTHWQKEGDTMSFLYLVPTGMNDPEQPAWGSWAGRYGLNENFPGRQYYWANQADAWNGVTNRDNTLRRWAADLQNDFRARLDWCVKPFREANHPPRTMLNSQRGKQTVQLDVTPGTTVSLDAFGSTDPDENPLRYEWFDYPQASTYRGSVNLMNATAVVTSVEIPADALGKSIHVILAVRDDGQPPLVTYRRAVLNVRAAVNQSPVQAGAPDLIVHHGKIIAVDKLFSIREAMAIQGNKILQVGSDADMLKTKGPRTEVLDLQGKMVLPGLIDSHTHPTGAAMFEFDHPVPDMETIQEVLDYIKVRARVVPEGQWIVVQQVFITRLKEQRYPTRAELDAAAPKHPVAFRTGPDASVNTLALKLNGIDRNYRIPDGVPGKIEQAANGEPTGILRNAGNYFRTESAEKPAKEEDYRQRLIALFKDYNSVGLTSIGDRSSSADAIERFRKMRDAGDLTVRISVSQTIGTLGPIEDIQKKIREVAKNPLCQGDDMLRIIGIKTFLDGGMLTGSAYLREPWGVSKIYSIDDPTYRGVLFIPRERLLPIVRATVEAGLQFTAHSVGDGAVHTLLDVYDDLSKEGLPVRKTRGCVTHSNFMSRDAVETAARLGVVLDIQPIWLYLDTRTLVNQFGYERLRYFQPLQTIFKAGGIVGGGSDHMQKIGSFRSINPYNPFLGMQTAIMRRAKWYDGELHPEEALTRDQAIRFYTINNAFLLFKEDQVGSLESGKLADFIVLDTDLLTCPADRIAATQVLRTYVGGKLVYQREKQP